MEEKTPSDTIPDTPEQSASQQNQKDFLARIVMPNKKKLLFLLVGAVIIVGALTGWVIRGTTNETPLEVASSGVESEEEPEVGLIADEYIPEFSDMRGYAELADERWYVTFKNIIITDNEGYRVYTSKDFDAITSFTDIIEVDGTIWIGGQGGVARYDKDSDTFVTLLEDVNNVILRHDQYDSRLYAGTFTDLYAWNDSSSSFELFPGATRDQGYNDLAFTDSYILVQSSTNANNNSPLKIFDKNTQVWSAPSDLAYSSNGVRSADVSFISINNTPIVYGRDVRYKSCENHNQYPASVFYSFQNGEFKEETELNKVFFANEARAYAASSTALRGSANCVNEDDFVVDIVQKDGNFTADMKRETNALNAFSFYSYFDKIQQLEDEVGFSPSISPMQITADKLYTLWDSSKDGNDKKMLITSQNITQDVDQIMESSDFGDAVSAIQCNGRSYIINSSSKLGGYTSPSLLSIYDVSNDTPQAVFVADSSAVSQRDSTRFNIANTQALCIDSKITLLGIYDLGIFDPADNSFTQIKHDEYVKPHASDITPTEDRFVFVDLSNKKLVSISNTLESKQVSSFEMGDLSPESSNTAFLVNAGEATALGISSYDDKFGDILVTLNTFTGSVIQQTMLNKKLAVGSAAGYFDSESFILQYTDAETNIVAYESHAEETISKNIFDADSFPPIKAPDSEFLFDGSHVWYEAENWGIFGLRVRQD